MQIFTHPILIIQGPKHTDGDDDDSDDDDDGDDDDDDDGDCDGDGDDEGTHARQWKCNCKPCSANTHRGSTVNNKDVKGRVSPHQHFVLVGLERFILFIYIHSALTKGYT